VYTARDFCYLAEVISTSIKRPIFRNFHVVDIFVLGLLAFLIYGSVVTAQRWTGPFKADYDIDLSFSSLPRYGIYSLFRACIAYGFSLIFSLVFGYLAARYRRAEQIILPLLDIGQSIPVIGFLPGLVLGLMSIFSKTNFGLELACVLMIFTSQVWNLAFSFYSSMKGVPKTFHELSANVSLSWWQKFVLVELPCSASGLAWNSLMSMAGGWFFLTICEAFTLSGKDFRLEGLGSYMAVAIEQGNVNAMLGGFIAVIVLILGMDFIVWRPIIAWTRRFRLDESPEAFQEIPFMQLLLQESKIVRIVDQFFKYLWYPRFHGRQKVKKRSFIIKTIQGAIRNLDEIEWLNHFHVFGRLILVAGIVLVLWASSKIFIFLEKISVAEWILIVQSAGLTLLRVFGCLLVSIVWTVPFGLWVGLSSERTRVFQPLIQLAASFPAPMLYPLVLMGLQFVGIGLGIGSGVLMLLGVQWYVLFNVLAGATMISRELRETFLLVGLSKTDTWKNLYIPSILPNLVTGLVTAAGGAWNSSIVAEYVHYKNQVESTMGLGALISEATSQGNYSLLAGSLVVMMVIVVGMNRLLWHRIYDWVDRRYRFER
jgi:NitT/TauT family transport system permease protein